MRVAGRGREESEQGCKALRLTSAMTCNCSYGLKTYWAPYLSQGTQLTDSRNFERVLLVGLAAGTPI